MNESKPTPGKVFNAVFSAFIGQFVATVLCAGQPLWLRVLVAALSTVVTWLVASAILQRWQKPKDEA